MLHVLVQDAHVALAGRVHDPLAPRRPNSERKRFHLGSYASSRLHLNRINAANVFGIADAKKKRSSPDGGRSGCRRDAGVVPVSRAARIGRMVRGHGESDEPTVSLKIQLSSTKKTDLMKKFIIAIRLWSQFGDKTR